MEPVSTVAVAKTAAETGAFGKAGAEVSGLERLAAEIRPRVEDAARTLADAGIDPQGLARQVLDALHSAFEQQQDPEDQAIAHSGRLATGALAGAGREGMPKVQKGVEHGVPGGYWTESRPLDIAGLPDPSALAASVQGALGDVAYFPIRESGSPQPEALTTPLSAQVEVPTRPVANEDIAATDTRDIPATVDKIDGKYPVNAQYAGQDVPLSEFPGIEQGSAYASQTIHWSEKGFPDFSPWVYRTPEGTVCDVHIEPTGSKSGDPKAANTACGLTHTPEGYCWHHHQDTGRMQLVPLALHGAVHHTGGWAIWGKYAASGTASDLASAPAQESFWQRIAAWLWQGGTR